MKSTKKLNNVNNRVQLIGKVNNIQSTDKKLKLKILKERRKRNKKISGKRKAIQMTDTRQVSTRNIEGGSSKNDLNNTNHTSSLNNASNEINEECNGNPVENSQHLFQWLLNPVNIETFFK